MARNNNVGYKFQPKLALGAEFYAPFTELQLHLGSAGQPSLLCFISVLFPVVNTWRPSVPSIASHVRILRRSVSYEPLRDRDVGSEAPRAEPDFMMGMPKAGRLFLATCLCSVFVLVLYLQSITKPGKTPCMYTVFLNFQTL